MVLTLCWRKIYSRGWLRSILVQAWHGRPASRLSWWTVCLKTLSKVSQHLALSVCPSLLILSLVMIKFYCLQEDRLCQDRIGRLCDHEKLFAGWSFGRRFRVLENGVEIKTSRVPTPPGKSWIFFKFQDLESPGKSLLCWKVLEKLLPPDVIFQG